MRTSRGKALGGLIVLAALAAGCSSSSSSQGVVSTTAAAQTTEAAGGSDTTAADATADDTTATDDTTAADTSAAPASEVVAGGILRVGLDSEPAALDPAGNSSSLANGSVYDAVYDGLTSLDLDGNVTMDLAESLTESADRMSWTLVLRQGITFQDGTPFDGASVKFNLDRQKTSPYNAPAVEPLDSVEVVDDHTVTLKLNQPWVGLPAALAGVVGTIAAPSGVATDPNGLQRAPIGTGPYTFTEWATGDSVTVTRNEEYWNAEATGHPDQIVYKFLPVEAARSAAFQAGELDVMLTYNNEIRDELTGAGFDFSSIPPTGFGALLMNQTKPPFDDVRVRQALQIGADYDAIGEAYQSNTYADFSFSPFYKGSKFWSEPTTPAAFDAAAATALIEDYGQPVEFKMLVLAGNQVNEDSARARVEYWNELGVDSAVEIVPDLGTYVTRVISGDFDMAGWIYGSFGDPDAVTYGIMHTGGSTNYGKYSNPAMDELLQAGRQEGDEAKRMEIYAQVQDLYRQDIPNIITNHGPMYIFRQEGVAGTENSVFLPSRTVGFTG